MSSTIAITGKGGVGKTTVAGLLVARLIARGSKPVLAVDADPNTCLDAALGVQVRNTIGQVREQAREAAGQGMAGGISKQQLMELRTQESLVEADDFDLIAMGRPEGPGCYCFANNVLKETLAHLSSKYPYVVLDNEAGLENLSRRIVQKVDLMVMVTDPSKQGLETVRRLHGLAGEMNIAYGHLAIVVNRTPEGGLPAGIFELSDIVGTGTLISLPEDQEIAALAEQGKPLIKISKNNLVMLALDPLVTDVEVGPK